MFDPGVLLRNNIRKLTPYSSAREEHQGGEIFLDANENSLGSALREESYNRYPDPLQRGLKERLAPLKGVTAEQTFLGNGSDEAIDLLIRAFCEPGRDAILICPPTYGMYAVCAAINNIDIHTAPLTPQFDLDWQAVISAATPATKLIFLCSPNNPTGNCLDRHSVAEVLERFSGIVVIDEAYIDFCPDQSWLPALDDHPNLVVLQTLSKAWGLAGLRLGMAFASPEIIRVLNAIKFPYNVNELTQNVALEALEQENRVQTMVDQIRAGREHLAQALNELPLTERIFPSRANFLLVRFREAPRIYRELQGRGILVRDRTREPGCADCLRITVGTPQENQLLINHLTQICEEL